MRFHSALPFLIAALAANPLRASDPTIPACLLFHSTVPTGSYSGSAALSGGPGGVLDDCTKFSAPGPWQLSHVEGTTQGSVPSESITLNTPMEGFGFWVGQKAWLSMRFFLGGVEQHYTDWFTAAPHMMTRWDWTGTFDRVDISGVHVLMLYGLDLVPEDVVEPLLQPEEEDPPMQDLIMRLGDGDPSLREDLATTVPEPATLTLLASGLVGMAGASRRKRASREM